jgi:hypothetical protein
MTVVRKVLWCKVACQWLGCPRQVLFTGGFCIAFNLLIHQVDNPQFWDTVRSIQWEFNGTIFGENAI